MEHIVSEFTYKEYQPLLKPQLLEVSLNSAHRTLNKLL
jgi:hypothetical protein